MQQFILNIELQPHATFANFVANQSLVNYLQKSAESLCLVATKGEGISHLLQAVCYQATEPALYLPLAKAATFTPDILQGCAQLSLIAIDDLELIAGDAAWEQALFSAFNQCSVSKTCLWFGLHKPLAQLAFKLPDLSSRLQSLNQLSLTPLTDHEKAIILQQKATQSGFILSPKIAHYILKHQPRDLPSLLKFLNRLAFLSLRTQRRVTLPLLRQLLYNNDF